MNDESFDSLQIIESMVRKAKNQFSENGHLYLLWGWTVFFCSLTEFILINYVHYSHHYIVWFVTWIVIIYQLVYLRKKRKRKTVRTYTDEIIGFVWLVFFILMVLFGFFAARQDEAAGNAMINTAFLALYGMPTFLSGIILRFRPLVVGGICCWVLSVASTLIPLQYDLLLISLAMIAAWIIPGYLLRKRNKLQTN
jgi:FtsH-binding integral membrane protein